MSDVVIDIENVSKQYRLGQVGTGTLAHDLNRWLHKVRGKEDPYLRVGEANDRTKKGGSQYVWALQDINFSINKGDVVGIIGRNGAGKSTLLKILSRTTTPSTGSVKMKGRIASLLEVGTGFHPELSGRENIFLNGAILGMSKAEIKSKFDEIVDFAGVERYIDTPVKRYSSGMYVRLAFGVAAHLESEILIVDEVLAVGDVEFQKKCLGKMKEVSEGEGRTVLFVSHNMQAIANLCNNCVVLNSGRTIFAGPTKQALTAYLQSVTNYDAGYEWKRPASKKMPALAFSEIKSALDGPPGKHTLRFLIDLAVTGDFKPAFLAIDFSTIHNTIMQALPSAVPFLDKDNAKGQLEIAVELPGLIPGVYYADFWLGSHNSETIDFIEKAIQFEIVESPSLDRTYPHTQDHGFIVPHSTAKKVS